MADASGDSVGLVTAVAGSIGAVAGGFFLWLAQRLMGRAAIQTAINDGFAKLVDDLQAERRALIEELERRDAQWAIERDELKGEIRQLKQLVQSAERPSQRSAADQTLTVIGGVKKPLTP